MPRLTIIAVACAALALALGACGKDDEQTAATPRTRHRHDDPTPAAATSTQSETPSRDIVSVGHQGHQVRSRRAHGEGRPEDHLDEQRHRSRTTSRPTRAPTSSPRTLNDGDTFEYTPTKAGTIDYVCTIHPGQNGTITVTE